MIFFSRFMAIVIAVLLNQLLVHLQVIETQSAIFIVCVLLGFVTFTIAQVLVPYRKYR